MRYGAAAFELLFQLPQIIFAFRAQKTSGMFSNVNDLKNYPLRIFGLEPKNAFLGIPLN